MEPKKKTPKRIIFDIDELDHQKIKKWAKQDDTSIRKFIIDAIKFYIVHRSPIQPL